MQQNMSLIAKNTKVYSYFGLFLTVAVVNYYTCFINELANQHAQSWEVVCFTSILYLAPNKALEKGYFHTSYKPYFLAIIDFWKQHKLALISF